MLKASQSNTAKINIKNKNLITNKCYINGVWVGSDKNFKVTNPATGQLIIEVPD